MERVLGMDRVGGYVVSWETLDDVETGLGVVGCDGRVSIPGANALGALGALGVLSV